MKYILAEKLPGTLITDFLLRDWKKALEQGLNMKKLSA